MKTSQSLAVAAALGLSAVAGPALAQIPAGGIETFTTDIWDFMIANVGLMIVGLIWIVTFYLTRGEFPVQPWGNWNLAAGFGLIIAGFLMTTNWR